MMESAAKSQHNLSKAVSGKGLFACCYSKGVGRLPRKTCQHALDLLLTNGEKICGSKYSAICLWNILFLKRIGMPGIYCLKQSR